MLCLPRGYFGPVCADLRALDSEVDTVVGNLLSGVETSDGVDLALNAKCPIILTTLTAFGIGVCRRGGSLRDQARWKQGQAYLVVLNVIMLQQD